MIRAVLLLALFSIGAAHPAHLDEDASDEVSSYHKMMAIRKTLLSRLDRCTQWRDQLDHDRRNTLHTLLIRAKFEKFRELSLKIARDEYPADEDCLKSVTFLIRKYNRVRDLSRRQGGSDDGAHIEEFLSSRQISELHAVYHRTGRREEIENALEQYFEGMASDKKDKLISDFFSYKNDLRRRPRHLTEPNVSMEETAVVIEEPEELKDDWLTWMDNRQKSAVSRLKENGNGKWEVMNTIANQYYHLKKDVRKTFDRHFQHYCSDNLRSVLGGDNFAQLEEMFLDNDPVDQIETRFHEMIGDLRSEQSRILADRYGSFCRKIFRLVHFEPTDLTTWLDDNQKGELGRLIVDPDIGDQQVYEKVYDFFVAAVGEQKEEATNTIDTGCRHFIAHTFGDDTAEELEDLRSQGNVSSQVLASRLAKHVREINGEKLRRRAEQSLPMCTRIYLNYTGSCDCNGHSDYCDPVQHTCQNCTGFTHGVQCEQCLEGFTGDPKSSDGCVAIETEVEGDEDVVACQCNEHSATCDLEGKCTNCGHNTEGDSCDRCIVGYYGDASTGGLDDCSPCPCPGGGACFINDDGLVQCARCPAGRKGVTCDDVDSDSSSSEEQKS